MFFFLTRRRQQISKRTDTLFPDTTLFRSGVVEAQVAQAAELGGDAEVQADRLGVADVQVAVGLGREAGADGGMLPVGQVLADDLADEVLLFGGRRGIARGRGGAVAHVRGAGKNNSLAEPTGWRAGRGLG